MPFPTSMRRGPSDDWGRTTDEQEDLDSLGFQEMKEATEKVADADEDDEETDAEKEKVAAVVVEEDEDIDGLAELERLAARTREEQDAIVIEEEEEI